jgi:hypothetical protein
MTSHQISVLDVVGVDHCPVYIHKIDKLTFWNAEPSIEARVDAAITRIFRREDHVYSFWRIESARDLYCVAASLNAGRSSPKEEIPFIWVTDADFEKFGLNPGSVQEGACLYSKHLHYDVPISPKQARILCFDLMSQEEEGSIGQRARRYKRNSQMSVIVEYLIAQGCKAYPINQANSKPCSCELS